MNESSDLATAWQRLWQRLGATGDGKVAYDDLVMRYSEPHRRYHTLSHVTACLSVFDEGCHLAEHPDEVVFAIWLHDAVYDPRATDNELQSAKLADDLLQKADCERDIRHRVQDLILATRHRALPIALDEQLLVDVDLSILGEPAPIFDAYDRAIRLEYGWVSEDDYRKGRAAMLRGFLARDCIFTTTFYRMRFETQARANIARAIAALDSKTPT